MGILYEVRMLNTMGDRIRKIVAAVTAIFSSQSAADMANLLLVGAILLLLIALVGQA